MESQVENKFVWVIKHAISLLSITESDLFVIAGCIWRLSAHPKENNLDFFYQYCGVADPNEPLPSRWRRYVKLRLRIVNRLSERPSIVTDSELNFDEKTPVRLFSSVLSPSKLLDRDGGFLENRELMIVVEEVAHKVFGAVGESNDYQLLSTIEESHGADETRREKRSIDIIDINGFHVPPTQYELFTVAGRKRKSVAVNGFHVLPSKVETVKGIFQKYPDCASRFRFKNRYLRSTYMSVVLGLIETLCQPPEKLTYDNLDEASYALSYAEKGGFDLDWLEQKLNELKAKKIKVDSGKARIREIVEELEASNQRWYVLIAHLEREKADMSAARAPLSFDDVV